MNIQELKENLQKVILLREEVSCLQKHHRRTYSLREYTEQFRERLIFVDHGERDRFSWPVYIASKKLDELYENRDEFEVRFSASKAKLLSAMGQYIKDIQRGIKEHEAEQKSSTGMH